MANDQRTDLRHSGIALAWIPGPSFPRNRRRAKNANERLGMQSRQAVPSREYPASGHGSPRLDHFPQEG